MTPADVALSDAVTSYRLACSAACSAATRAQDLAERDRALIRPVERCVLVLDDDDAARAALVDLLMVELHVPVHSAATPREASVLVAHHRPAVVVCDYLLRVGRGAHESGLAFVAQLPRAHRAVIVSGHADFAAIAEPLMALGVRAFVRPVSPPEERALVAHVHDLIFAATGGDAWPI